MLNKISFSRLQPLKLFVLDFPSSCFSPSFPDLSSPRHPPWARRPNSPFYGRSGCLSHIATKVGRLLGNHIRSYVWNHMSDPTIWTASFYRNLFHLVIQAEMKKTEKTETAMTTTWTRQQHAFTSRLHPRKFTQKFAGQGTARLCPCTESL